LVTNPDRSDGALHGPHQPTYVVEPMTAIAMIE
jgi:hypothetical protein